MPILGGNTHDELTFGNSITEYFSGPPQVSMTAAQYLANVNNTYPAATAAAILAAYPLSNYASPQLAWAAVGTDPVLACPARHVVNLWARWVRVYQYEFEYPNAPYYFPAMPGFAAAAAHTIDIQFLFPNWHGGVFGVNSRPLNADETKLSDQLVAAWTHFASTGNPNGSGNAPWPLFSSRADAPAIFAEDIPTSSTITDARFAADHHCDLWDPLANY